MAEKRKGKKRKDEYPDTKEEVEKPSSLEYNVAKWLRSNVPTKKTKFLNHHVEYFIGSKAIDALLTSKFASGDNPTFVDRADTAAFLYTMLTHKFFHRAKKVPVSEQELRGRGKKKEKEGEKEKEKEKEKEEPKKKEDAGTAESQTEGKDGKGEGKEKEQQRKKRKIRLEMHNTQLYVDGPDAYVWIYDPIPFYYWIIGALLVFGAIGVCMFPLWPHSVRKGVYYLSVAAAGFLVLIIALTTLRLVIFCLVWVLSFSRHHFWLLPNLTEDVGFFASFWPLYQYEYRGPDYKPSDKKKGKKKKDKLSDDEEDGGGAGAAEEAKPEASKKGLRKRVGEKDSPNESDRGEKGDSQNEDQHSPQGEDNSESEGSQRSSTGKDFEMVNAQDVDTS